jgi:Trk K+ transport system NAD-binding subunit
VGKSPKQLDWKYRFNAEIIRIIRGNIVIEAPSSLELLMAGDIIIVDCFSPERILQEITPGAETGTSSAELPA